MQGEEASQPKETPETKESKKKKKELLVSIILSPQCSSSMKPAAAAKADPRPEPLPAEQWDQESGCSSGARAELAALLPPAGRGHRTAGNASCSRT